jgi:hypothetical protein
VRPSSVVSYASSPPFQAIDGVVRLQTSFDGHRKTPHETRHLYRRADQWLYRLQITKDHLRGSGSVAPVAIADLLGLSFGETCELASPLSTQAITWTSNQPTFGSIRRLLIRDDISIGTEVFLVIADNRTFYLEIVPPATGDSLTDALTLVGAKDLPDVAEAHRRLTKAICSAESISTSELIASYHDRGDHDIADLLFAGRHQLGEALPQGAVVAVPEIDEILGLL